MALTFESLPVELIADILGELDLESLIRVSQLCRRLYYIASDSSLNPWRHPILRTLRSNSYELSLKHLSVRSFVPRRNWVEILSIARPTFILFEATLPNLKATEWEECFRKRFLPGWQKWKKDSQWKEAFMKILYRTWHRSITNCTSDEAWTKYIVLNRNGSANELEASSRNYNPVTLFHELKLQNNLAHLETRIRLVVAFADVRILAFGVLNKPRSSFSVNPNARVFLHPPGVEDTSFIESLERDPKPPHGCDASPSDRHASIRPVISSLFSLLSLRRASAIAVYERLMYPLPTLSHANYPLHTPGGGDKRWFGSGELEEEGLQWVGVLMLVAQLVGPHTHGSLEDGNSLQDLDLVTGAGRHQYASFTWSDFWAISPWMKEKITKKINGPGLGN